jgi:curved DNA-binding protein CbpA
MTRSDAEKILGVQAGASPEEIKAAYKHMASRWHPDRHGDDPAAATFFRLIREAYEELQKPPEPARKAHGVPSWLLDLIDKVAAKESREELSGLLGDTDRVDALQSALRVFLKMSRQKKTT